MGSYPLTKRLNVDQVPFNLLSRESRTYVPYTECAHVVIPGATPTEKRFGTLQVCSAVVDPQPPLSIIFRGKGNIEPSEKNQYDERVNIFWQPKAWADEAFCCDWIDKVLKPFTEKVTGKNFYLLMDHAHDPK